MVEFASWDLKAITNDFGEENFITKTQFGMLYRGRITLGCRKTMKGGRKVTVKIWCKNLQWFAPVGRYVVDQKLKLLNELRFLFHSSVRGHSNLVKLLGFCLDQSVGLYAIVFSWPQRIKVALEIGRLLVFLHGHKLPYMLRNLDAMHIVIDVNFSPVLVEFGMLSGGIMGELTDILERPNVLPLLGSFGYVDLQMCMTGDGWLLPRDVYSFGALLLSIITKRVVNKYRLQNTIMSHDWAQNAYEEEKALCHKESECSIACGTLKQNPAYNARDGHVVTLLGMQCMEFKLERRPTMKDICKRLQSLRVVKQYKEIMLL
ncbi:hypothetical protein COLO4_09980 [Corchorus olitorius]|uniref:Protein kinase domain-containing protein n=1 Tax=Corchorus olitorius TaxID=93759 RepID=A0A1R3KAF4_9ROSI|nr:hypothetical protein COLO4_09980 [Corchorus olitorius]